MAADKRHDQLPPELATPGKATLTDHRPPAAEGKATGKLEAAVPAATPLEELQRLLFKPVVSDKAALDALKALPDKACVDDATIVAAIKKLSAKAANRIRLEAGARWSDEIVDAILAQKSKKSGWHAELDHLAEEIATALPGDPRSKLLALVTRPMAGYKPEVGAFDHVLAVGKPFTLALIEKAIERVYQGQEKVAKHVWFRWSLSTEPGAFEQQAYWPGEETIYTSRPTFEVTAIRPGETVVEAEGIMLNENGVLAKFVAPITLSVFDQEADGDGYFEARFREHFAPALKADCFAKERTEPGAVAALFNPLQRARLEDYLDTRLVPATLFENGNIATGTQRELIASHMLTFGKILLGDEEMDGVQWAASCCGGWVQGVRVYAGINAAVGYGSDSVEQSGMPTGGKSYGSGTSDVDPNSNKMIPEVSKLEGPIRKRIRDAAKAKKAAKKVKDQKGVDAAQAVIDKANAELLELKPQRESARVAAGSGPNSSGHVNMPAQYLWDTIRPGDWLFIDNNGAAGHSVIFASWADDGPTTMTEIDVDPDPLKEGRQHAIDLEMATTRTITYRTANVYNQPVAGGRYNPTRIGFPHSSAMGVSGVYAITHASDSAEPAATVEAFLAYDRPKAMAANAAILDDTKHGLSRTAVQNKLAGAVQAVLDGITVKTRADQVGNVAGTLSDGQRAVAESVLKGTGDSDADIANLVALGQKLSVLLVIHGDSIHPNGKLETGVSTWKAPWPAWKSDPTLRVTGGE
ncbi:MAG: hypothetical protein JNL83_39820 [Myxococcales bacterium]|nr:hypothetical protein [Myxococcales bacterium]